MAGEVVNIVVAGLGGQGVLKASNILSAAVFATGLDVKKAEVHGMSQRGGSVRTDVRFGPRVLSPMVTEGEADFLVVLAPDQVEVHRHVLAEEGVLIAPDAIDADKLPSPRSLNVALLGVLSKHLDITEDQWRQAVQANLPAKLHEMNAEAFALGRNS